MEEGEVDQYIVCEELCSVTQPLVIRFFNILNLHVPWYGVASTLASFFTKLHVKVYLKINF